jgi:ribosomal protein S3
MTWNYRIIKHGSAKHNHFAIHEVFYDDKGKITNWTERPIDIIGESKADIKRILKQMTLDIETPILSETDLLKK